MLRQLARIYAMVAAIALPLLPGAILIAAARGVDLGIVSRWIRQGDGVAAAAAVPAAPAPTPLPPDVRAAAASEARAWAARMASLAQEIAAEAPSERGRREAAAAALSEREKRLGEAVARLSSLVAPELAAPLAPSDWPARADEIIAAIEKARARQEGRQLSTLAAMDARALAELIVGSEAKGEASGGMSDADARALLVGLAPKKAGEVLAAIARRSPDRAAKLAGALVGGTVGGGEAQGTGAKKGAG